MRKIAALFTIAFLCAGLGLFQYFQQDASGAAEVSSPSGFKPKAGFEAAAFSLTGMDEKPYKLEQGNEDGKLMFVNFWASWCGPCEMEAADLQKLHENYGDVMTLYGVNSTNYDKERSARAFVEEHGLTFPILMDREGAVTKLYKVNTFPTSFLIDSNGVIRERINGVITYAEWERLIQKWTKSDA
ncbi:TlpA disulfide reductase family protein [Paenibacillus sp. LHD-117]|uniref:TlpA family protein disulfide reductase n=1 Tax=Paenibacillus sp. LHD-117 TaxID=3071412 RepID=UPI0027E0362C|nr:TlpA disulfide reductase family protein [Paenibacillus sp. LHD-117]MDQ6423303.1 TlpA disulfide reductase family protein [Paenibacillus sp. LHD-117]